jgi:hypothetical protein
MMRQHSQKLWQAACCLLCLFLAAPGLDDAGEATGGWLTGPLIRTADVGSMLFVLALNFGIDDGACHDYASAFRLRHWNAASITVCSLIIMG